MALIGKEIGALLIVAAAPVTAAIQFDMRHDHLHKGCLGTMVVDEQGISFTGAKKHAWRWQYDDIQELKLSPGRLYVLTYRDRKLRLGADRAYEFEGAIPDSVYAMWKERLDQRFVAALVQRSAAPLWRIPAKHLRRISGSDGMLEFGEDRIVYAADRKDESRTWRFEDIDNISSSGPFQLTITSFERARGHYGDRKGFNFQLKQPLSEVRFDDLWLRINQKNGRIQQ